MAEKLIEVKNLKKYYPVKKGGFLKAEKAVVKAIDDVSFDIYEGETLGLVGESGCGKTTTGRAILQLIKPTFGEVIYDNTNLTTLSEKEMRKYRQEMQIIFQDPYGCLDPRKTVEEIIGKPLKIHGVKDKKELEKKVLDLMNEVGLREDYRNRYPHEFSGGQRQRIGIARAIALNPKFIVCDEPVSALDVSIQAQVINLMNELQKKHKLTYLFISHDLRVIKHICDRVVVMYLGRVMEMGKIEDIYKSPAHPYTKVLLSAIPNVDVDSEKKTRLTLEGDIPSPLAVPSGCRFHTRCSQAMDICSKVAPEMVEISEGHFCECHLCKKGKDVGKKEQAEE